MLVNSSAHTTPYEQSPLLEQVVDNIPGEINEFTEAASTVGAVMTSWCSRALTVPEVGLKLNSVPYKTGNPGKHGKPGAIRRQQEPIPSLRVWTMSALLLGQATPC